MLRELLKVFSASKIMVTPWDMKYDIYLVSMKMPVFLVWTSIIYCLHAAWMQIIIIVCIP